MRRRRAHSEARRHAAGRRPRCKSLGAGGRAAPRRSQSLRLGGGVRVGRGLRRAAHARECAARAAERAAEQEDALHGRDLCGSCARHAGLRRGRGSRCARDGRGRATARLRRAGELPGGKLPGHGRGRHRRAARRDGGRALRQALPDNRRRAHNPRAGSQACGAGAARDGRVALAGLARVGAGSGAGGAGRRQDLL